MRCAPTRSSSGRGAPTGCTTGSCTRAPAGTGGSGALLPEAVQRFLEESGLGSATACAPLAGGVSSDIWRVELADGPVCVKRALPRLRVQQVWEAPVERNAYERDWLLEAAKAVPGAVPRVLAQGSG